MQERQEHRRHAPDRCRRVPASKAEHHVLAVAVIVRLRAPVCPPRELQQRACRGRRQLRIAREAYGFERAQLRCREAAENAGRAQVGEAHDSPVATARRRAAGRRPGARAAAGLAISAVSRCPRHNTNPPPSCTKSARICAWPSLKSASEATHHDLHAFQVVAREARRRTSSSASARLPGARRCESPRHEERAAGVAVRRAPAARATAPRPAARSSARRPREAGRSACAPCRRRLSARVATSVNSCVCCAPPHRGAGSPRPWARRRVRPAERTRPATSVAWLCTVTPIRTGSSKSTAPGGTLHSRRC